VRCVKFVVPEGTAADGDPNSLCRVRRFRARLIAHNVTTDYACCQTDVTVLEAQKQLPKETLWAAVRLSKKLRFFDKGDCTPKGSRFSSKSCRTFWGVKCDFRCACPRKSRF